MRVQFENLSKADLYVDAVYEGGNAGHIGDDPISKLLGCGNQGGFRYSGSTKSAIKFCVLYSSLREPDWPDRLDLESGRFIYYGDNRTPGDDLHKPIGNRILRQVFDDLHSGRRDKIPPFFIFTKGARGRDVIFRGLAVPGALSVREDLLAVWRSKDGKRFQNYRAVFTILDVPHVRRAWIQDLQNGHVYTDNAPDAWKEWVDREEYQALFAPATKSYRTKSEQIPEQSTVQRKILERIISYFKIEYPTDKNKHAGEYAFENCAAEIVKLMDSHIVRCDVTRPWRDGGRDALGYYQIGPDGHKHTFEFALEAKCKFTGNGSGVRDVSRLISRLRHRQFGVFVTTSYVAKQAYEEIVADQHPVIIISGIDIVQILMDKGYSTVAQVEAWLKTKFPFD